MTRLIKSKNVVLAVGSCAVLAFALLASSCGGTSGGGGNAGGTCAPFQACTAVGSTCTDATNGDTCTCMAGGGGGDRYMCAAGGGGGANGGGGAGGGTCAPFQACTGVGSTCTDATNGDTCTCMAGGGGGGDRYMCAAGGGGGANGGGGAGGGTCAPNATCTGT